VSSPFVRALVLTLSALATLAIALAASQAQSQLAFLGAGLVLASHLAALGAFDAIAAFWESDRSLRRGLATLVPLSLAATVLAPVAAAGTWLLLVVKI